VREVYPDLAPGLEQAAVETVLAHLIKLRDDGRVRQERENQSEAKSATWTHVG